MILKTYLILFFLSTCNTKKIFYPHFTLYFEKLESALDTNNDGVIDEIVITNAIKLLEKARK